MLVGNLLLRKGIVRAGAGNKKGKGIARLSKRMGLLLAPHPLTNFEIKEYYRMESRFNGVYSRDNLPEKIKEGAFIINLDEYAEVGTYWVALFFKRNEIVYFDSFGVEDLPEEIKEFIVNNNIFRVPGKNSIQCG